MKNRGSTPILTNLVGVHLRNIHTKFEANPCSGSRKEVNNEILHSRGKKILKFPLVPLASTSKFLLVLLPNNLSLSRKNKLALNFLLARPTLGEKICLSCLKFNLSRAPGQVIFLPLHSDI